MTDLAANIDAVTELVREHAPAHLAAWWRDSLAEFNTSGGRKTLCACLGLTQADRDNVIRLRNSHLRAAYRLAGSVRNLAAYIQRFETTTWPRVRYEASPPQRLTPLQVELFCALRCGVGVPIRKSQLATACVEVSGPKG